MTISYRFNRSWVRRAAIVLGTAMVGLSGSALAQEKAPGPTIDPNVFGLFLESRIQKPAAQATAQERTRAQEDLTGLYLVTNLDRATELGDVPRTKAQLELQRRAILYNAFAVDFLAANTATDKEISDEYAAQFSATPPKEFKARHILLTSQAEALGLIEELQAGANFAELAKAKSTGPSGPAGGDLGWFAAKSMVKPFSDAVIAMEDGAFSTTPVQTQFGWHVILREETRDGTPPPLDSVRDVIKQQIEQDKFKIFVDGLR